MSIYGSPMFNFIRCVALQCTFLQGAGLQVPIFHNVEVEINMQSVFIHIYGSPIFIFIKFVALQ